MSHFCVFETQLAGIHGHKGHVFSDFFRKFSENFRKFLLKKGNFRGLIGFPLVRTRVDFFLTEFDLEVGKWGRHDLAHGIALRPS